MNENEKYLPKEEIEEVADIEETDEELTDGEEYSDEESEPDDEELTDADEYTDEDSDVEGEASDEEEEEAAPAEDKKADPEAEKPAAAAKTASDADKRYNRLLRDTRRALEALGIKTGDDEATLTEIVKLAAEQKGKSVEEYNKDSDVEDEFLEFKRQKEINAKSAEDAAWEERLVKDLADIQAEFPEAKKYTHISQFPNWKRFGELMDTGTMSAVEAFKLSHPTEAEAKIVAGVKQASLNDTKTHLRSSTPKPASGGTVHISHAEMEAYRDMFPDLSDAQIRKYHAKVTKK